MNHPRHLHRLLFICLAVTLLDRTALGAEIGLPDKLAFLALLKQGEFETLNRRLSAYQEAFEAGVIPDTRVDDAFSTFANSDPALEPRLAKWIHQMPDSYAAQAARGRYYSHLAWLVRGNEPSGRRHKQQIAAMDAYFTRAKTDLAQALNINTELSVASALLVRAAMAQGDDDAVTRLAEEGLAAAPRSVMIRRRYMANQLPWWGGTLEEMGRYLAATRQDYPDDDLLREIYGYHDFATATTLNEKGGYEEALQFINRALEQSGYWFYQYRRAQILDSLERYQEALADIDAVIIQRPQEAIVFDFRGRLHNKLDDHDAALADLSTALKFDPYSPYMLLMKANILRDEGRPEETLAILNQAMVHGSEDRYIRDARGRVLLYGLDQPAEALADLKYTTELRPNSKRYWYNYGRALVATYDCESTYALARYWDLCDRGARCTEGNVKWAKAIVFGSLHHTSCWPAFARSLGPLARISLRKVLP
jgi:tetratricopeptide (TPR) repeat protein